MEFAWTESHRAFRKRVRDFLKDNLPADWPSYSCGYDTSSGPTEDFARSFCPKLADAGLLIPHWPVKDGGAGLDAWHHWILNEEMWAVGEPRSYQYMSVNWAGPAIISYGTAEQREEHIPKITKGEIFYCQGFSEPDAGSDLASLRTRAEKIPDGYRINGQKIWTSAASFADYCILLARTGGDGRHGISCFVVPMNTPGITVRVIDGVQGARSLHEVFWDNVEVPESTRLGPENGGWEIVTHILHNERVSTPCYALTMHGMNRAVARLKHEGRFSDPAVRSRAAHVMALCEAARLQCYNVIDSRVKDKPQSAFTNTARYALVLADRAACDFICDFLADVIVSGDDQVICATYRRTGSTGVAAGAAEIQLNLVARNLLNLPKAA